MNYGTIASLGADPTNMWTYRLIVCSDSYELSDIIRECCRNLIDYLLFWDGRIRDIGSAGLSEVAWDRSCNEVPEPQTAEGVQGECDGEEVV